MNSKLNTEKTDSFIPPATVDYQSAERARRVSRAKCFAYLSLLIALAEFPLIMGVQLFDSVQISIELHMMIRRFLVLLGEYIPFVGFILGMFAVVMAFQERRYSLCFIALLAILISAGFLYIFSLGTFHLN